MKIMIDINTFENFAIDFLIKNDINPNEKLENDLTLLENMKIVFMVCKTNEKEIKLLYSQNPKLVYKEMVKKIIDIDNIEELYGFQNNPVYRIIYFALEIDNNEKLFSTTEVMEIFNVSKQYLMKLREEQKLLANKISTTHYYLESDIINYAVYRSNQYKELYLAYMEGKIKSEVSL
jgi:hypothetical protein